MQDKIDLPNMLHCAFRLPLKYLMQKHLLSAQAYLPTTN